MSKMMIYALKGAVGGTVEKVYGYEMQTCVIDSSDEKAVAAAKENGYYKHPQEVIDLIEAEKLQAENKAMKGKLADNKDAEIIKKLEDQLSQALVEVANFEAKIGELEADIATATEWAQSVINEKRALEAKLAIYEESKDVNGDGVVSYDEMTNAELHKLLDQREVKYVARDSKDDLIQKAKDSE